MTQTKYPLVYEEIPLSDFDITKLTSPEPTPALVDSILKNGILEPIIIGRYRTKKHLISGKRRIKAAYKAMELLLEDTKLAQAIGVKSTGYLEMIPAIVYTGINPNDRAAWSIIVNEHRSENPLDAYDNYRYLTDNDKWTDIKDLINMNPSRFKKLQSLDNLKKNRATVFGAVERKEMAVGTMYQLAKLGPQRQTFCLALLKANKKLTSGDIKTAKEARASAVLSQGDMPNMDIAAFDETQNEGDGFIVIGFAPDTPPAFRKTFAEAHQDFLDDPGSKVYRLIHVEG